MVFIDTFKYPKDNIKETILKYDDRKTYLLLQYDRNMLCYNDMSHCFYRSVLCSYPERELISVGAPLYRSSLCLDTNTYSSSEYRVVEKMRGSYIQIGFDHKRSQWIQYSRNKIEPLSWSEESIAQLPKCACYTFQIREHDYRVMSIYKQDGFQVILVDPKEYSIWCHSLNKVSHPKISYPIIFPDTSKHTLQKELDKHPDICGYIISHIPTSQTYIMYNSHYSRYKTLSNITGLNKYTFLCMLRIGKIYEYIYYFPHSKRYFTTLHKEYLWFMEYIHQCYVNYYIRKMTDSVPSMFLSHIYKLHHEYYLRHHKSVKGYKVTLQTVKDYFAKMDPHALFYHAFEYNSESLHRFDK